MNGGVRRGLWPCPNCGHENPPEASMCENCGAPKGEDTGDSGDNRDSEDLFLDEEYL